MGVYLLLALPLSDPIEITGVMLLFYLKNHILLITKIEFTNLNSMNISKYGQKFDSQSKITNTKQSLIITKFIQIATGTNFNQVYPEPG